MKKTLLVFFKYVAEHPEKTLEESFSITRFRRVFWYYESFLGVKPLVCPTCGKMKPLTKHHVIPKKNGGKGIIENHFYICRECHDYVHEMFTKRQKMERYLLEYPDATVEELMELFHAKRVTAIAAKYPEYFLRISKKYENRLNGKIRAGMGLLENHCITPK